MSRVYDRPVTIQMIDEESEGWIDWRACHCRVNKARTDNEYVNAGAIQSKRALSFETRYFNDLENIALNTQLYRIVYAGIPYNIEDYDDYMLKHMTVTLLGVSY